MTHKKVNTFIKSTISLFLVICSLSSIAIISTNAASKTVESVLPNSGYVVSTKAEYLPNDCEASSTGRVVSGPPMTIKVWGTGYFNTSSDVVIKAIPVKQKDSKSLLSNYTNTSKIAIGCKAKARFHAEKTYTVRKGYTE